MMKEKEDWLEYVAVEGSHACFLGYLEATEEIVESLEQRMTQARSFEELKKELLVFCAERKDFLKYAFDNLP